MEGWPEGGGEARASRRGQPPPADGTAAWWCTSQCAHSPLSPSATPRGSLCSASQGDSAPDAIPGRARYSCVRAEYTLPAPRPHCAVPYPCSPHPIHCGCTPANGGCAPASAHAAAHPYAAGCAGVSLQTCIRLFWRPLVEKIGPNLCVHYCHSQQLILSLQVQPQAVVTVPHPPAAFTSAFTSYVATPASYTTTSFVPAVAQQQQPAAITYTSYAQPVVSSSSNAVVSTPVIPQTSSVQQVTIPLEYTDSIIGPNGSRLQQTW